MIANSPSEFAAVIKADIENNEKRDTATWNAICLADMGDTGMAFVALPQMAPRNVTWAKKGKWVHLAKIGLEKYFLMKMKRGVSDKIIVKMVYSGPVRAPVQEGQPIGNLQVWRGDAKVLEVPVQAAESGHGHIDGRLDLLLAESFLLQLVFHHLFGQHQSMLQKYRLLLT